MKLKLTTLLLLTAFSAFALEGKVVSIADGDTITILTADNLQVKVRLSGIDTPERNQAYGTKAKEALGYKVHGRTVTLKNTSLDRYGRTVADVYHVGRWINLEMVREGWAWHYKQYSADEKLADAESYAKKLRRGLWSDPNPIPPWEFRNNSKKESKTVTGRWLNKNSGVRHNNTCPNFDRMNNKRPCGINEGRSGECCGG